MSFVLTLVNVGWKPIFYRAFLKSFGISTAVSFLLTFFVIPVIQRALDRLFVIGEQNGSDF
jgi:antibiotic biosynthesis monooxygenase (ABM) superfamily enzyme